MTESRSEFESAPDAFPVKLSNFEGPLDLLLHLIRKHELDIHDIPIALITAQYLDAIALMQELDLDVAGEFLVMAATLIHIKSKMLLPRPETAAGVEGEVEDPRDALVRRLLEHQKFKAAAGLLHEREQLRAAQWLRPDGRVAELAGDDYEPELEVDLFSLMNAFQAVVERLKQRPKVLLPPEEIPVELRIEQLLARLSETEAMRLRGSVLRRRGTQRPDRHVPGAARNDSLEAREGLPVRQLRPDSRLQARAAGRRAAPDWRPGGKSWLTKKTGRMGRMGGKGRTAGGQDGLEGQDGQDRREADAEIQEGESLPKRGAAELKAILEALIFASPDPLTPKAMCKLLDTEPKEDVLAALAELKQDYERPGRPAAGRGRRRLSDRHALRSARVGAPPVPRADDAEAHGAGARDAGGHRLPAADHRARRSPRSAASTPRAC